MTELEQWSDRSAELYDFIFDEREAAANARKLRDLLLQAAPHARSLLDVACGTGSHLKQLTEWYDVEGVDASPSMLQRARSRLPGTPLHQADMRSFDLRKTFDIVICLSSSIAHMRTLEDLDAAAETIARHTSPAGVVVIEPWDFPEDGSDERPWLHTVARGTRAVALMETTTLADPFWTQETHLLVWEAGAGIEHLVERSTLGAFTKTAYVRALDQAGLSVTFEEGGLLGRGLFVAKPRSAE